MSLNDTMIMRRIGSIWTSDGGDAGGILDVICQEKRRNETHLWDSWLESDVDDLLSRYVA